MAYQAWLPNTIDLVSDDIARNKCMSRMPFEAGAHILSVPSFATTLFESEKGRRCDSCLRHTSDTITLKRCAGCGSYWYCSAHCQAAQWKLHHKRICVVYNAHLASEEYQALPEHRKLDSMLLSHAIARLSLLPIPYAFQDSTISSVLMSLLPFPDESVSAPPTCRFKPAPPDGLVRKLYARFGNNHFAIHSHLTTVGHGIFPQASRLFNHSCSPNAAAKYILSSGEPARMVIVALRTIPQGEEICLPYLDPALLETREHMLEISYGFQCHCPSSLFLRRVGPLPEAPQTENELRLVSKELREFMRFDPSRPNNLSTKTIDTLPPSLHCILRESYMGTLSEIFSKASHEGQYEVALDSGTTLLCLYSLVYPPNYPQIGMHLLEMAKTTWNAVITSADQTKERALREQARRFLALAQQVLDTFGPEGDDDGPLQEIAILNGLLLE